MNDAAASRYKAFRWRAGSLMGTTVVLLVVGVLLIRQGAYPPPGKESSGNAGVVAAGTVVSFLALVSGLLALYFVQKARTIAQELRAQNVD